jgi:hexosaminidase
MARRKYMARAKSNDLAATNGPGTEPAAEPTLALVPLPASVVPRSGAFVLGPSTRILLAAGTQVEAAPVGQYLAELFRRPTGLPLPVLEGGSTDEGNAITLSLDPGISHVEGYRLLVSPTRIKISARTSHGLFYGVQTLRQIAPVEVESPQIVAGVSWRLPAVEIEDAPRFPYRGMLLDVGRHFFPTAFIQKYIDLLASYKLNTFHWHLTDDQGWRIEIKKYPRLTEVGAWRRETEIAAGKVDGQPYGGFYSQEEIRDVVRYAESRFVTVMPEIELPGHTTAALAAYPELGCTPGPFEVATRWGVKEDILCPTEKSFTFLEDVLTEVMALFPSRYIHVGGDEVPTSRWKDSRAVQELMQREGIRRVEEVHGYFMRRIGAFLAAHGRQLVGWDEILEGGHLPDATVMSWRGQEGGVAAARQGQDVIMAPHQYTYFDHYQSAEFESEPLALAPNLPLEKVYEFEPVPKALNPEEARHVLGAQGNLWTEWVGTPDHAEHMLLPRMLALAEVVWSPKQARDWSGFARRLAPHFTRLALLPAQHRPQFNSAR